MAMTMQHLQTAKTTSKGIAEYMTEEQFGYLKGIMQWKKVSKGTFLFWEGDEAEKLYYIRSGQVKLLKSTEDGKDLIFSFMQQGDLIAEMNSFTDTLHTYSGEVVSDAEIGVINRKDLEVLFVKHGDLTLQFMYWLGMSHRIIQSKLRDLLMFGKPGALASTLIRLSNMYGVQEPSGALRIDLKLTNSELGEMIGATRESVNRMLSDWKETGTLEMEDGKIIIHRMEQLRRICQCPKSPTCPIEICRL